MDDSNNRPSEGLLKHAALQARTLRNGSKPNKSLKANSAHTSFTPISEQDGLYFRFAPSPGLFGPTRRTCAQQTSIRDAFQQAFAQVWSPIPKQDRQRLRDYWQAHPRQPSYDEFWPPPPYQPLIEIVDGGSWSQDYQVCKQNGTELSFPMSLVAGHPECLIPAIGRALAHVYRLATGSHWRRVQEVIEEPLARWEKRLGKKVTGSARDRKLEELEAAFAAEYEADLAELLNRWGLEQRLYPTNGATTKE